MKVVHIIPGSGGSFYCGNCLRDSKFFEAIRSQGADAIKLPMYLPLFAHDKNKDVPVFYGAISIYLKQLFPIFRYAPKWFDNFLNAPAMLRFAAKKANSTRAKGLEEMTISMLMGEQGKQKKELDEMTDWLANHFKPDIVHISNALLLGLTHQIKEKLNVPVVCSLQDEDVWVDAMKEEYRMQVWDIMKEKAKEVDMFVSVSDYFTHFMQEKLSIPNERITSLHLGVDPTDYTYINAIEKEKNIGFLSRMCKENGLDILIDAFILFKKMPSTEKTKLMLTGGYTSDDKTFLKEQKAKIRQAGLNDYVVFLENFGHENRIAFFNSIALLSVPVRQGEAFGIYLTEAMASGVPIVQPPLGAFPEIVEKSQGGFVYKEKTPQALAEALYDLMKDNERLNKLSKNARHSTETIFNIHNLSQEMIGLYKKLIP